MPEKVWFLISEKQLQGLVKYEHKNTREHLAVAARTQPIFKVENEKVLRVPVVSLEWLEDYADKRIMAFRGNQGEYARGALASLKYLLEKAKKESEKP